MKPRASMPATRSMGLSAYSAAKRSTAIRKEAESLKSVVTSLKFIPGMGKSGMLRIFSLSASKLHLISDKNHNR